MPPTVLERPTNGIEVCLPRMKFKNVLLNAPVCSADADQIGPPFAQIVTVINQIRGPVAKKKLPYERITRLMNENLDGITKMLINM